MQQPASNQLQVRGKKFYEIPTCTICLEPMLKDLASFQSCGHVFHYNCAINCHSNSRKCPNCRVRSLEIGSLHFQIEEITGVDEQMLQIIQNLSSDQKELVSKLLIDQERLLREKTVVEQKFALTEEKIAKYMAECDELKKTNQRLGDYNKNLEEKKREISVKHAQIDLVYNALLEDHQIVSQRYQKLQEECKQFEYYKFIKELLECNRNEDEAYIKQIRLKPLADQVQNFYDSYIMKKGQCKELQLMNEQVQRELEQVNKKFSSLESSLSNLQKENQTLKDYIKENKKKVTHQFADSNNSEDLSKKLKRSPFPAFGSHQIRKIPITNSGIIQNAVKKDK